MLSARMRETRDEESLSLLRKMVPQVAALAILLPDRLAVAVLALRKVAMRVELPLINERVPGHTSRCRESSDLYLNFFGQSSQLRVVDSALRLRRRLFSILENPADKACSQISQAQIHLQLIFLGIR